jgi:hypothetical protein
MVLAAAAGYIDPDKVAEMFIGDHVSYDISECKLVSDVITGISMILLSKKVIFFGTYIADCSTSVH